MTREEASIIIGNIPINGDECYTISEYQQAKAMAIKALEHPERNVVAIVPCGDTISRQAVLDIVNNPLNIRVDEIIKKLPPVTPQQKTAHWIHFANSDDCSGCGWSTGKYISPSDYCPKCGARMIELAESEGEE